MSTYVDNRPGTHRRQVPLPDNIVHRVAEELGSAVKIVEISLTSVGILSHIIEQVHVARIGDVERGFRGVGLLLLLRLKGIGQANDNPCTEAAVEQSHVVQVLVPCQRRRRGRVSDPAGLGLHEDAIHDGVADCACKDIFIQASGYGQLCQRDGRTERNLLGYLKADDRGEVGGVDSLVWW